MTMPMPQADKTIQAPPAAPPAAEHESFVINLCSSTTPMALTQPQLVELKRFSFFVSRRLEDGRERFRLHMGYFDSLLQAEELLPVVREIYPGAWAGEAPGKRLRARAAAQKAAPVAAAPASMPPQPVPLPTPPVPVRAVPTLGAAPEPALEAAPLTLELVPQPERVVPPAPLTEPPAAAVAAAAVVAAAPPPPAASAKRAAPVPFDQRSNVREVLNALDETGRKPVLPVTPAGPVVRQSGVLPESQVLHLLEEKRGDPLNTISTPAAFSIQLQWSVQPIDLAKVPPLAIFGAYTLYTVEGSREGRRWFGLRLGFFSDANSAKQVAQYVRSEFSSVAVVPVSLKERDGASGAIGGTGAAAAIAPKRPTERRPEQTSEFKLLDDTGPAPKLPSAAAKPATGAAKPKTAAAARAGAAGRTGQKGVKTRGRLNAHERRSPQTLEETLEILGAGELQIEGARRELTSEGQIRHLDVKVQKHSPFSRLLDRLAERGR
ncbi:MAG TPA: hypothetical protein VHW25_02445 [Steroidobacteraceae bacterium]|nr:hypothetical protein [Steroidobacteraceae bacterium]